jgi:VanZ family protein
LFFKAQGMLMTRRKAIILVLALYWPALFIAAHIPIPQVVRRADMSDKRLHFLMYAILTFLFWSVIRPHSKVDWRRATAWLTLLAIVVYGICDEVLQHFVGRTTDVRDLAADTSGAVAAMLILSVCSFWPAGAIITAMGLYALPGLARKDLMDLLPVIMSLLYVGGYSLFTLLWMRCLHPLTCGIRSGYVRFLASVSGPLLILAVTKASTTVAGRPFGRWDMVAGTVGIGAGILIAWVLGWPWSEGEDSVAPARS